MTLSSVPEDEIDEFEASWFDVTPRHPVRLGTDRLRIRFYEPCRVEGWKIYHGMHGDCLYIDNFTEQRDFGVGDDITIEVGNLLPAFQSMFGDEIASNLTIALISQDRENTQIRSVPPYRRLRKRKPVDERNINWLSEGF